jgi:hypothetical protein
MDLVHFDMDPDLFVPFDAAPNPARHTLWYRCWRRIFVSSEVISVVVLKS